MNKVKQGKLITMEDPGKRKQKAFDNYLAAVEREYWDKRQELANIEFQAKLREHEKRRA